MGCGELAHVLQSQVIEGRKLELEGADRRDQKNVQVGRDGGKWVHSGLGEQDRFHCDDTGLALSSRPNGWPTASNTMEGP